jgi:hypothetical protein
VLKHVSTNENTADIATKPYTRNKLNEMRARIMMPIVE